MRTTTVIAAGLMIAFMAQARNKEHTRLATTNNPTFDIVVSYWKNNPDAANKAKVENIISNFADGIYEMTEGAHRLKDIRIYTKGEKTFWSAAIYRRFESGDESPHSITERLFVGSNSWRLEPDDGVSAHEFALMRS